MLARLPGSVMTPGLRPPIAQIAAVIPVVLLVVFIGLLWLLGLACGRERRRYVTNLSQQAMSTVGVLLHGPSSPLPPSSRIGL
jgi:hypothetical protein